MRIFIAAVLAALGLSSAPVLAVPPSIPAIGQRLAAVPGFSGIVGARRGGAAAHISSHGRVATPWTPVRWASVTKAVTAVLVLQQVDAGRMALDAPISTYLPDWPANPQVTVRQLLMHRSGLANPDAGPDADGDGMPDFHQGVGPGWRSVCAAPPSAPPGGDFAYDNCDYLLLGAALEGVTGLSWAELVRTRIESPLGLVALTPAPPGLRREAFVGTAPETPVDISSFGPAGDLYGGVEAMLAFDQALMDGRLISDAARDEMWRAGPETGYGGLSVWIYDVRLAACGIETRVVERQGGIGGVQVRNFLMPELNAALVIWTDDGALDLGQTWSGQGLSIDLLAAVACGEGWGSKPPA